MAEDEINKAASGKHADDQHAKRSTADKLVLVVGLFLSVVSTAAAAYSAWASQQSLTQSQEAQLLERRINGCIQVDRRAGEIIRSAWQLVHDRAYDRFREPTHGGDYWGEYDYDYFKPDCPDNEPERSACTKKFEAAVAVAGRIRSQAADKLAQIHFGRSRVFDLMWSPPLAEAEARLAVAVDQLSIMGGNYESITADNFSLLTKAEDVRAAFREACAQAVGVYRLPASQPL